MVNVFTVVGEHKVDATRLLVLGVDGRYYDYLPIRRHFTPVTPDSRWLVYGRGGEEAPAVNSTDDESGGRPAALGRGK